jgi:hypothetical protein
MFGGIMRGQDAPNRNSLPQAGSITNEYYGAYITPNGTNHPLTKAPIDALFGIKLGMVLPSGCNQVRHPELDAAKLGAAYTIDPPFPVFRTITKRSAREVGLDCYVASLDDINNNVNSIAGYGNYSDKKQAEVAFDAISKIFCDKYGQNKRSENDQVIVQTWTDGRRALILSKEHEVNETKDIYTISIQVVTIPKGSVWVGVTVANKQPQPSKSEQGRSPK